MAGEDGVPHHPLPVLLLHLGLEQHPPVVSVQVSSVESSRPVVKPQVLPVSHEAAPDHPRLPVPGLRVPVAPVARVPGGGGAQPPRLPLLSVPGLGPGLPVPVRLPLVLSPHRLSLLLWYLEHLLEPGPGLEQLSSPPLDVGHHLLLQTGLLSLHILALVVPHPLLLLSERQLLPPHRLHRHVLHANILELEGVLHLVSDPGLGGQHLAHTALYTARHGVTCLTLTGLLTGGTQRLGAEIN